MVSTAGSVNKTWDAYCKQIKQAESAVISFNYGAVKKLTS
jgi:hypothetical protein